MAACDLDERRASLFKRASLSPSDGAITAALPRLFANEGLYLAPGPFTERGPAGVARVLGRDSLNATTRVRMVTIGGDVSASGDDGFTYGYVDGARANGDSVLAWYHAYWRRDATGDWKILAMARRRRPSGSTTGVSSPRSTSSTCNDVPSADTTRFVKEMMATDLAFSDSAARSVSNAFATFAAADATKSGKEAAYVAGKSAIGSLFDPPPPTGLQWEPEIGTAARSGDLGFTIGSAWARVAEPNAPPRNPATAGHYFTIWKRDTDGRWRFAID